MCSQIKAMVYQKRRRKKYKSTPYQAYCRMIFTQYKIREPALRDLMDRQKGCCAICGSSLVNPEWKKSDMHIDHSHSTGEVRGLLCGNCNWLIGVAREDAGILRGAIKYLQEI